MLFWLRRVSAVATLEARQVLSHPVEWLAALVVPLFWCTVLALAFGAGTLSQLPVGFVDLDGSAASREVRAALAATPSIRLVDCESGIEADRALRRSDTFATLTIPRDFELDRRRGVGAPVLVDINKSWYAVGTILEVDLKTALSTLTIQNAVVRATTKGGTFAANASMMRFTQPDVLFLANPAFNFVSYLLPTLIPGVMALGALLAFVSMLTREWRQGGMRRVLKAAGGSISAAVAGKLTPWLAVWLVAASCWVAWFSGAAGWGATGPLVFWFTAAWLLVLSMAALATLAVAVSPTWVIALSLSVCLIAPTFPFTGFSFPLEAMTPGARLFGFFLPLTHYLEAQAQVWVLGSPADAIARTQLEFAAFPVVMFAVAVPLLGLRIRRWRRAEQMGEGLTHAVEAAHGFEDDPARARTGFFRAFALTLRHAFLSRDTIAILGGAVAFYLIFYGWPYGTQQIENVPTAVVDLDGGSSSRRLVQALDAAPAIGVTAILADEAEAMDAFRRGEAAVVITIPRDYGERLARGENATLHVLGSGAFPVKARAVQGAVSGVVADMTPRLDQASVLSPGAPGALLRAAQLQAPSASVTYRFNEISGYGNYTVPAVGPVILQAVMLMGFAMSLGGWLWRHPRRDFVRDAVARPWCEGVAIAFAFWTIAFGWYLYMEGFAFRTGEYGAMANPPAVILTGLCYAAALTGFGMAIVTTIRSNAWTAPITVVMSAPALFISGAVWPTDNLHPVAVGVSQLLPSTPAIRASVAAAQDGAALADVLPHCLHLVLLAAFFGLYSLMRLKTIREERRELAVNDVV